MDKENDRLINQYISVVCKQTTGFVTEYLCGSIEKGNERPESDIDIALNIIT